MTDTTPHHRRAQLRAAADDLRRQIARREKNVRNMDRDLQERLTEIKKAERETGTEAALLRRQRQIRVENHGRSQRALLQDRADLEDLERQLAAVEAEIDDSRGAAVAAHADDELRRRAANLLKALASVRALGSHYYPPHLEAAEEQLREVVTA